MLLRLFLGAWIWEWYEEASVEALQRGRMISDCANYIGVVVSE